MDRSSKAVISQVLADSVTPILKRHGFDRRGRTYDRARDGRRELINIEPHNCNRYGGSFRINLGIFIPEVDSILSLYPLQVPPQECECHIRCGIDDVGPGGRMRDEKGADAGRGWRAFDAATELSAFGAEVRQRVEHNALGFFDDLSTRAGILAWLRRYRIPARILGLHRVVLAAYAGDPTLAQEWLDMLVAEPSPGPNRVRREAARIGGRLGLTSPAPTDTPALTAVFRVAADTTPQDRHSAFYHLDYKFRQYVELFRTVLPVQDPAQLYHTAECSGLACTVSFYGADPEDLLGRLRRAFERLSEQFAEITWHVNPAAPRRG
ncbi:DUF4304 domain-containing protein [Micromonospora sp. IBHARD004]|uniref:DUF4304 domain-containing protein n=1 Tax=Micromonospora sp. IBHARD004 TaxID=3457764 RepID=UPI004059BB85